jgi:hypothetical protein
MIKKTMVVLTIFPKTNIINNFTGAGDLVILKNF